jgi:hypothetical protein
VHISKEQKDLKSNSQKTRSKSQNKQKERIIKIRDEINEIEAKKRP